MYFNKVWGLCFILYEQSSRCKFQSRNYNPGTKERNVLELMDNKTGGKPKVKEKAKEKRCRENILKGKEQCKH